MPLLFAVTLFLSASLLFMVQPMVGKMILPLLGGSPAVWNACMVFFQVLLLLGYMYAHWLSTRYEAKAQGKLHTLVLAVTLGVFALSAAMGAKHTPIAIAEGLAPTDGANPFLAVLALLTVAIGIPFFTASTSAPLLQRWFSLTGHPSSRDPYFLYAASNVGSLVSLLGYPLFIEPSMTIHNQAWLFAGGFAVLAVLIVVCARAAANPVGAVPAGKTGGKKDELVEPPPSYLRIAKWVLLAFVPSSLMLSVTFYMSTDIASVALLWVIPLALYLVTFIISFSTMVPPWFRTVIGNVAPVTLLLLVFTMVSGATGGKMALTLTIHIAAFFCAALMCHYELARDRPKDTSHLTAYFLWMSFGGMLGGMFNGLIAPIVFTYANEYPITIVIACGMVPAAAVASARLAGKAFENTTAGNVKDWLYTAGIAAGISVVTIYGCRIVLGGLVDFYNWFLVAALFLILVAVGWYLLMTREFKPTQSEEQLPLERWAAAARKTNFYVALDVLLPVIIGLLFWGLCENQYWNVDRAENEKGSFLLRTSKTLSDYLKGVGIDQRLVISFLVYGIPVMACFFFVDRPLRFAAAVAAILLINTYRERQTEAVVYTDRSFFGILKVERGGTSTRLVHGTTLHGTQFNERWRLHRADIPVILGSFSGWDSLLLNGSMTRWDARQEPLTYYHRTGPVGAMFYELRSRKGGADAKADIAMVGLGTGSAACYCLPGQKLTFYEIDPAVVKIVVEPWMVMNKDEIAKDPDVKEQLGPITYVDAARKRGALIDFRMGDARLKLRDDKDRKYGLLLVDAFSSDAIPVHLLTKEAVAMYMDRLTDDGLLALHISNKYVRLEPVVAKIAQDLKLQARVWNDDSEGRPGKTASSWVVLAKDEKTLGILNAPPVEQVKAFGMNNEALTTLLEYMDMWRSELVLIVAGYEAPMERFLAENPGFKSRFAHSMSFGTYTPDEVWRILTGMARQEGRSIDPEVEERFKAVVEIMWDTDQRGNRIEQRAVLGEGIGDDQGQRLLALGPALGLHVLQAQRDDRVAREVVADLRARLGDGQLREEPPARGRVLGRPALEEGPHHRQVQRLAKASWPRQQHRLGLVMDEFVEESRLVDIGQPPAAQFAELRDAEADARVHASPCHEAPPRARPRAGNRLWHRTACGMVCAAPAPMDLAAHRPAARRALQHRGLCQCRRPGQRARHESGRRDLLHLVRA